MPNGYNQSDGGEVAHTGKRHRAPRINFSKQSTGRMTFGESLRRFRNTYNLKQNKVAESIGMTPQQYMRYEKDMMWPSVALVVNIADAFNVSADYLLGLSDEPHPTAYNEREVKAAFALRDAVRSVMMQ